MSFRFIIWKFEDNNESIRLFSKGSVLHIRWPKYWSFSFSISPFKNIQYWFPLGFIGLSSLQSKGLKNLLDFWIFLRLKGLKNLLQHCSSKASVLRCSAFFMVQFLHPYVTTGKTIALTRVWIFDGKVMSLPFNILSRLVITFLPRSKRLLISWLQSHLQWSWSTKK